MSKKTVAVALSGGVDSSTTAFLLKEAGYEVLGIHMHLWHKDGSMLDGQSQDYNSTGVTYEIEQLCCTLGIPFYIIDLEHEFNRYVLDYFCDEYMKGLTPNPCIACNRYIKFGVLLDRALSLGVDYLATGHYARIKYFDDRYHLLKGVDTSKDQSYFLYSIGLDKLGRVLFPLGDYRKAEVREVARQNKLPVGDKPSSQDLCFISGSYGAFLSRKFNSISGDVVTRQGEVVGRHKGVAFYTVGQRHGLEIASDRRLYVTKIEPGENRVVVGVEEDLYRRELTAGKLSWLSPKPPSGPMDVTVKIRYKSPEVAAKLYPGPGSAEIRFCQPQRAVTPGQAVVFYHDSEVIGGGIIENEQRQIYI